MDQTSFKSKINIDDHDQNRSGSMVDMQDEFFAKSRLDTII